MKSAIMVVVSALLAVPGAAVAGGRQDLEQRARIQTETVADRLQQQRDALLERKLKEPPGPEAGMRADPQAPEQESPVVAGLFFAEL